MKTKRYSQGQVVLITLLVLTIATTVALSLISRTTTDTTITNQVEESSRAFSAAEAGVEQALAANATGTIGPTGIVGAAGVSYNVLISSIGAKAGLYEFPQKTLKGTTETLWLVAHDQNGALVENPTYTASSIDVCWSKETPIAALEVTLLYKESSAVVDNYRIAKVAYDPDPVRFGSDKFTSTYVAGGCGVNTGTDYRETITFNLLNAGIDPTTDTLIALRIRPLFNDAKIVIDPGGTVIPSQGNQIESTGSTITGTNRKIVVYQQYRSASSVFDAALYSQGAISY